MGYVAPTWQNGGPPALNAKNMQDISDNLAYVSNHMVNPNLLINWYFGNPVNQRGASYVENNYGLDRWKGTYGVNANGTMGFNSSGFAIQGLEDSVKGILDGMMLTASILYVNGTLQTGTAVYTKTGNAHNFIDSGPIQFNNQADGNILLYAQSADQIKAVKLELGSQQTLAHQENGVWVLNEIPKFGDQLAECQRYYFKTASAQYSAYMMRKVGNDYLMDSCLFPVTMRTTPSIQLLSYRNPATGAVITAEGTASQVTPDGFCIVQDVGKFNSGDVFQVSFSATADL